MAEDNATPAAQTPGTTPTQAGQTTGTQGQGGLTMEAVAAVIEERMRPLAAALRRVQEGVPAKAAANGGDPAANQTLTQQLAILRSELKTEKEKVEARAREDAIRDAFAVDGMTAKQQRLLLNHVRSEYSGKIAGNKDEGYGFKDELGNLQPLTALRELVLADIGDTLKPAKQPPGGIGLKSTGSAGLTTPTVLSIEALLKLPLDELARQIKEQARAQG